MDERRDPQPTDDTPRPLIAAHTGLPPTQEAWGAYAGHRLRCPVCRDIDAGPCATAAELHRAWEAATDDAFRRLAGETA